MRSSSKKQQQSVKFVYIEPSLNTTVSETGKQIILDLCDRLEEERKKLKTALITHNKFITKQNKD